MMNFSREASLGIFACATRAHNLLKIDETVDPFVK